MSPMRRSAMRFVAAFIIAPVVPMIILGLIEVQSDPDSLRRTSDSMRQFVEIAYAGTFLLGIPLWAMFRARLYAAWWRYVVVGSAMGTLTSLVITALISSAMFSAVGSYLNLGTIIFDSSLVILGGLAIGVPYGAAAGLAFWLIALYKANRG